MSPVLLARVEVLDNFLSEYQFKVSVLLKQQELQCNPSIDYRYMQDRIPSKSYHQGETLMTLAVVANGVKVNKLSEHVPHQSGSKQGPAVDYTTAAVKLKIRIEITDDIHKRISSAVLQEKSLAFSKRIPAAQQL